MPTSTLGNRTRPIPAEPFSAKQLAEHARQLAGQHRVTAESSPDALVPRLEQTWQWLDARNRMLMQAAESGVHVSPAGKWLLDNFPLVRDQVERLRHELPRGQAGGLPCLSDGSHTGLPRIYDLALELLAHSEGQLDGDRLHALFAAYQSVTPLTLDELWTTANMLRLALVETLCNVSLQMLRPGSDGEPDADRQRDAVYERWIRNLVLSLRGMDLWDWRRFVEMESAVERILREDPAGVYAEMDDASRDRYRLAVEQIARRSSRSEVEVAQRAVALARGARRGILAHCHVGYYLVDQGRPTLEEAIGYRRSWRERIAAIAGRAPLALYLGGIVAVWLATVGSAAAIGWQWQVFRAAGLLPELIVLALLAGTASQFAVGVVNWLCTRWVPPRPLMKLDFSRGVPAEYRTLVVVPSMFSSTASIRDLVEQLERRYLANRDANIFFALLTDFPDAQEQTLPDDRRLLSLAEAEITRLNDRYCRKRSTIFYLLHRPRQWNGQEGVWMGRERKRGKLAALNCLLLTGDREAFSTVVGELEELSSVRYVITLDTDTRLPRDLGRELIGCMAHPLNWPQLDPQTRRVVQGHALLQPRVSATLSEANRSLFSRLQAGDCGIDPYTRQTSDVYQDVFGQGSFIGKGIYDVRAFSAAVEGRFPDNRLLSHDLIEGCYARSGLVSDLEFFEGLPSQFLADMSRRHRWIRGDWQIASWLFGWVPTAQGKARNPLDGLSRWKIFDNLRRSLIPPLQLAFLLSGWILLPQLAGYWTLLAVLLVSGPSLAACLPGLFSKPAKKPWSLHAKDQASRFLNALACEGFSWCVLPYVAHRHLNAIARAIYRLTVSHRRLLKWVTASDAEARCPKGLRDHYAKMWVSTATAVVAAALLAALDRGALFWAGPMLLLWLAGPLVAWRISRPGGRQKAATGKVPVEQVRRWARQTWHYFETFMNEQEHWLPPDNVQAHSPAGVFTRTSPTNIGMGLLAGLAAYDLGYLPGTTLIDRTAATLGTMRRLDRYRGHFYNWYDTRSLQPVEPRYVSSVDSGNLWGALTVLASGLEELRDRPAVPPGFLEGLRDTLESIAVLREGSAVTAFNDPFDGCLKELRRQCARPSPRGARRAHAVLCRVRALAATLAASATGCLPPLRSWTEAFRKQAAAVHREILQWAFWLQLPVPPLELDSKVRIAFQDLYMHLDRLDGACTLAGLPRAAEQTAERIAAILEVIAARGKTAELRQLSQRLVSLRQAAETAAAAARDQFQQIAILTGLCRQFCRMDFRFLYHPQRKLLSIGFQVDGGRRDDSYYDLLASEARLASFLAASHGQLPREHWFVLGRMMTLADGEPVLLSWAGSMFEYLMPALLMPTFSGTLLHASCRAAVRRQIRYARQHGVPWGISESCYNQTDKDHFYQYRAHGVPGLGFKRGLGEQMVVAPYASALAIMFLPREAARNLAWMEEHGYLSPHGFFDAIQFAAREPGASLRAVPCRTVMAHHSGMTLVALANFLQDGPMPRRFLKSPACAAHDLLLQERIPQAIRPIAPEILDDGRRLRRATAQRGSSV